MRKIDRKTGPPRIGWLDGLRQKTLCLAAGVFALAATSVSAGHVVFPFSDYPNNLDLIGNATWADTGGNPGGYLSLTEGVASQRSMIRFDDFDNGMVVAAFDFSCDLMAGQGTTAPADGFSVNYVRANDPVLTATTVDGFATGPNAEANLPEEGTQTGLGIGFDAWQSGDTAMAHNLVDGDVRYDTIGMSIRVDGVLLKQIPMRTLNGSVTDATSLQTGPELGPLGWANLKVSVKKNGEVSVWWKGVQVATNIPTPYFPSAGRLVFAARTGGSYQKTYIDNIDITTYPADGPLVSGFRAYPDGFAVDIQDAGAVTVNTNSIVLKFQGAPVTPTLLVKNDTLTTVAYRVFPTVFAPGSTNTAQLAFSDSRGTNQVVDHEFTIPNYVTVPATASVPEATVDKTAPGFTAYVHQAKGWTADGSTAVTLATTTARAEQQVRGLLLDPDNNNQPYINISTLSPDNTHYWTLTDILNFSDRAGKGTESGSLQAPTFTDQAFPGIPGTDSVGATYNNFVDEIIGYMDLPAGTYRLVVASDDGFRLTTGQDPKRLDALVLGGYDGGRGVAETVMEVVVPTAGFYPVRLLYYQGAGGADLEFFAYDSEGKRVPINSTLPGAIKVYSKSSVVLPALVDALSPLPDAQLVNPSTKVQVWLRNQTTTYASSTMTFNGNLVTTQSSANGTQTIITYTPTAKLAFGALNTVEFVYTDSAGTKLTNNWSFTTGGEAVRKQYNDITGTAVADLTGNPKYIDNSPDVVEIVGAFEGPVDVADNYGQELLGYLLPPVTGDYTFYISSDDGSELWVSTDESPTNAVVVCRQTGANGFRQFNNRSATPMHLEAGKKYFAQALMKEGGGGDNLSVAWTKVGDPAPTLPLGAVQPYTGFGYKLPPKDTTVRQGEPVTFSVTLVAAAAGYPSYQWFKNGAAIPSAIMASYTIDLTTMADNNTTYSVSITIDGKTVTTPPAKLTVTPVDPATLVVAGTVLSSNVVYVAFSEVMDTASAETVANYTVAGATISGAVLNASKKQVALTVSAPVADQAILTVTGVLDRIGNTVGGSLKVAAVSDVTLPGDPIVGTSTNVPGVNEAVDKAIDNNTGTKYLNFDKLNTGFTVTPAGGSLLNGISLTSGGDAPERDPASVRVEGSNDGTAFTTIAELPVSPFSARAERQELYFANTTAYKIYRVIFPTVFNAGAANSMQIAEVELLGVSATVAELPALKIERAAGNKTVVSWPASATGFTLQSKDDLNKTTWTPIGTGISDVGANKVYTNDVTGAANFFQLKK